MPKQTYTMNEFSGGMNYAADDVDLYNLKSVRYAKNANFDTLGGMKRFVVSNNTVFNDQEGNVSGNIVDGLVDLDRGIGNEDPSQSDALDMAIADITSSPSDELSWEDGFYNFRYTVCNDLGNGVIEEGPLQKFEGLSDNQNMTGDEKAAFTFSLTGDADPAHMDAAYATALKICGRVYYARVAGQGSSTQPGYIHLCDLIYTHTTDNDRIQPRAIGSIGDPNTAEIAIEEPPTSASFEMNAGYPSDVGILDVTASPFTDCESKVKLGMVTYVAKSGYIYRSVPGQPDIYPTDNWIDMTAYGTLCLAMYGIGNILCYFTEDKLILFDVSNDTIVKDYSGYGVNSGYHTAKIKDGVVFRARDRAQYLNGILPDVYYFDGRQVTNLTKGRHANQNIDNTNQGTGGDYYSGTGRWPVQYEEGSDCIRWINIYQLMDHEDDGGWDDPDITSTYFSFKSNTVFETNEYSINGGASWTTTDTEIQTGAWHANDPLRFKKIYKITFIGKFGDITLKVFPEDRSNNPHTMTKTSFDNDGEVGGYEIQYTPDTSLKVKKLYLDISSLNGMIQSIGIVYRMLNKF